MAFGVVLDTCVLFPFSLCDLLLRLADRELYDPLWSDRILEELERTLLERGLTDHQVDHRLVCMRTAFPEAIVPAAAISRLEATMTNDTNDRHVLAAAVASSAEAVVTTNMRHFLPEHCEAFDVEAIHPDQFLQTVFDLDPLAVRSEVAAQAAALAHPPVPYEELLAMLERADVPEFVRRVRQTG